MQRDLRRVLTGIAILAAMVAAFPVPPTAATPSRDPEIRIRTDDDDIAARRRCRWVWRHGLVCETKTTTVNP